MAPSVRISRKAAQAIVDALGLDMCHAQQYEWAFDALESALRPKPKKPLRLVREKAKRQTKQTKSQQTTEIRLAAEARSSGLCEACGAAFDTHFSDQLDHFWGRAKAPQSIENCWLLCSYCHRRKTDNTPSAKQWLEVFRAHCVRRSYWAEAAKAGRKLDALEMMEEAEGAR